MHTATVPNSSTQPCKSPQNAEARSGANGTGLA